MAKTCLVFEESDSNTNLNDGEAFPSLAIIPNMMGHKRIYIGTLLADLCSNILAEFATVVSCLFDGLPHTELFGIDAVTGESTRQRVFERWDVPRFATTFGDASFTRHGLTFTRSNPPSALP